MRESTLWMLHLLAGAVMLAVLGIHFGVMHAGELFGIPRAEVLTFPSVHARSGMVFYLVVYLILLAAALYHALYGLRSIIFEMSFIKTGARKAINFLLVLGGWCFFFYGAYVIISGYAG
jgi:succinate dehydrogenase / fumarate reductase membrane anchor subunit